MAGQYFFIQFQNFFLPSVKFTSFWNRLYGILSQIDPSPKAVRTKKIVPVQFFEVAKEYVSVFLRHPM